MWSMAWMTLKDSITVCKRSQSPEVYGAWLHLFMARLSGEGNWLSGREFERTPGDSGGPRSLTGYSPWGHEESDT